jgi:hypothetical protein
MKRLRPTYQKISESQSKQAAVAKLQQQHLKTDRWTWGFTGAYLKDRKKQRQLIKSRLSICSTLTGNCTRQVISVLGQNNLESAY